MSIHPTAIVHPGAQIGEEVEIGPYCIIHDDVAIGDGCRLESHVVVKPYTYLGTGNHLFPGVVLGGEPQDKKWQGQPSKLTIGNDNVIRECATIHRASLEDAATVVGHRNYFMAYSHIGHDATVGNDTMIASYVGISGFSIVEDYVTFGGIVGVHQYVRVGKIAMVGGQSKIVQDVPPFMIADGRATDIRGTNVVGLERAGVSAESRRALKRAHVLLHRSNLNITDALARVEQEVEPTPEVQYLIDFLKATQEGRLGRQLDKR
ncbi:MAG: acyl-ACP--UDP-N-acetylglucosamine O-acyltransferase [Armatimonadota bacterium]